MRTLALATLVLAVTACDSGEPDPPRFGEFEAAFTGDVSASLEGNALFQRLGETDDPLYLVTMTDGIEGGRSLTLSHSPGALSVEGTFGLRPDALDVGTRLFYVDRGAEGAFYEAVGGTLRVTQGDEGRIQATFEADLASVTGQDSRASVSGSFDAVPLPVLVP